MIGLEKIAYADEAAVASCRQYYVNRLAKQPEVSPCSFSPVAVCCVKPIYPLGDAKVKRLLQLCIHAIIISPDHLISPRPSAEALEKERGRRQQEPAAQSVVASGADLGRALHVRSSEDAMIGKYFLSGTGKYTKVRDRLPGCWSSCT